MGAHQGIPHRRSSDTTSVDVTAYLVSLIGLGVTLFAAVTVQPALMRGAAAIFAFGASLKIWSTRDKAQAGRATVAATDVQIRDRREGEVAIASNIGV